MWPIHWQHPPSISLLAIPSLGCTEDCRVLPDSAPLICNLAFHLIPRLVTNWTTDHRPVHDIYVSYSSPLSRPDESHRRLWQAHLRADIWSPAHRRHGMSARVCERQPVLAEVQVLAWGYERTICPLLTESLVLCPASPTCSADCSRLSCISLVDLAVDDRR